MLSPLNDYVYIVEAETEQESDGDFISGEDGLPKAGYGKIYALPGECTEKEHEKNLKLLKVGMNVWYTKYAAEEVYAKGEDGMKLDRLKSVHITSIHARDIE